jgi:hypothetical protein
MKKRDRWRVGTTPGLRQKGKPRFYTPWSVKVAGRYILTCYGWGIEFNLPRYYLVFSWRTAEGVRRVFLSHDGTPQNARLLWEFSE